MALYLKRMQAHVREISKGYGTKLPNQIEAEKVDDGYLLAAPYSFVVPEDIFESSYALNDLDAQEEK